MTVAAGSYSAVRARTQAREQKRLQVKSLKARQKEFDANQDFFQQAADTTQANARLARQKNAIAAAAEVANQGGGWLWILLVGAAGLFLLLYFKRKG